MNEKTKKWFKDAQKKMYKLDKKIESGELDFNSYQEEMAEIAVYYIQACNFDSKIWDE